MFLWLIREHVAGVRDPSPGGGRRPGVDPPGRTCPSRAPPRMKAQPCHRPCISGDEVRFSETWRRWPLSPAGRPHLKPSPTSSTCRVGARNGPSGHASWSRGRCAGHRMVWAGDSLRHGEMFSWPGAGGLLPLLLLRKGPGRSAASHVCCEWAGCGAGSRRAACFFGQIFTWEKKALLLNLESWGLDPRGISDLGADLGRDCRWGGAHGCSHPSARGGPAAPAPPLRRRLRRSARLTLLQAHCVLPWAPSCAPGAAVPPVAWPRSSFTVRPFPSPHTSVVVRSCHRHLCDNPGPRQRPPRGPFCLRAL